MSAVTPPAVPPVEERDRRDGKAGAVVREIMSGSVVLSIAAILLSFVIGGILIAASDEDVQETAGYFFARPGDMLGAILDAVGGAYGALLRGAVFNPRGDSLGEMLGPISETLVYATPLVAAGLGVAVAFRAGLFNIGGTGQIVAGAAAAGWVGFAVDLPPVLHVIVALVAGILGAAVWAGIVGILKARTGAHEVILTIMLNYIALRLFDYLLTTPVLQQPGTVNPISPPVSGDAMFPSMVGRLHWGFVVMLLAVVAIWWLFAKSNLGFKIRAVGLSPSAARTAGINVGIIYVVTFAIAGGLMGIAGSAQILGTERTLTGGIAGSIGFDAITVALLGRSKPFGVLAAGILFGALRAGSRTMQASEGVPVDIVLVVQSFIVLFLAAPPLVRAIFRLPAPGSRATAILSRSKGAKA